MVIYSHFWSETTKILIILETFIQDNLASIQPHVPSGKWILDSPNQCLLFCHKSITFDNHTILFSRVFISWLSSLISKMRFFSLAAFVVLIVVSWMNSSDAINVDVSPCLQSNWFSCGTNLGKAVFRLHSWSDDVSYQVQKVILI